MDSLLTGFEQDAVRLLISLQTANIKILSKDYNEEELNQIYPIYNYEDIIEKINSLKFIRGISKRIKFYGVVEYNKIMTPVIVAGIDFVEDKNTFELTNYIIRNNNKNYNEKALKNFPRIYLGKNIYNDLGLNLGDPIIITTKTVDGMFNSSLFIVDGIIDAPDISINSNYVLIDYSEASNLIKVYSPTEIAIKTDNFKNDKKYINIIKSYINENYITYWEKEGRDILQLTKAKSKYSNIFIFLIIIAIIGIINTMTLSVYQKMEEIGTLKAIGFNEKEINFLFTLEALLISILGSISGIILGLIINYFPYKYGMDLTKMIDPSQLSSFNTQSIIYSTYNIKPIFTSLFLGILLPYFFTRSIVKRASKLEPAFILRKIQ